MTTKDKLTLLVIMLFSWFKSKSKKELNRLVIESLKMDLRPKDELPLVLTEVYVDAPHIITEYKTWPDAMARIEKVRDKEKIYAVHVTIAGEIEYTWQHKS
ncbi:MAG: hypothetical protein LBF27_25880 [Sphingobacterium sp.]|jgi:hypothetical protein|nr:hypothetical protein [Sphingobacterium sp.]